MSRPAVVEARRVVVKVGSSSLTTAAGGIDPDRVRTLVDTLAAAHADGTEIVLVSSGAIAAGLAPLSLKRRPRDLARQQAAASVGQGILVHRYTEEIGRHTSELQSPVHLVCRLLLEKKNAHTLKTLDRTRQGTLTYYPVAAFL